MDTNNERLEINVDGASMGAYLVRPDGDDPCPGILLFMEVFGINEHIRSVADRVAAEGYVVMAPDVFHRSAPGIELEYDEQGLGKGVELMSQVTATELLADIRAALDTLGARADVGGRGVGTMGFCFGGHAAYLAACEFPIAATASFYGGGVAVAAPGEEAPPTVERSGGIGGKVLCLFGENDDYIPLDQVGVVRAALEKGGVEHEVVVYPGVGHGFFCDARDSYDAESAADAWARVTGLFASELA